MPTITRQNVLCTAITLTIGFATIVLLNGCEQSSKDTIQTVKSNDELSRDIQGEKSTDTREPMKIQYLEIVTPEVESLCRQYSTIYDVTFSEPNGNFGGARTAKLDGGGLIGIRGPLRDTETPVVRPYLLVDDIEAAVQSAAEAGAEIAMPPMEIPEYGLFAIVVHGGIECGFWQN